MMNEFSGGWGLCGDPMGMNNLGAPPIATICDNTIISICDEKGNVTWTLRENLAKIEKRLDKIEDRLESMEEILSDWFKDA